jgi:hypothetical protein
VRRTLGAAPPNLKTNHLGADDRSMTVRTPRRVALDDGPATAGSSASRRRGVAILVVATVAWVAWFTWRLSTAQAHPVWVATLLIEVFGVVAGVVVALALVRRPAHAAAACDAADRYPVTVCALVGTMPNRGTEDSPSELDDMHGAVRSAPGRVIAARTLPALAVQLALVEVHRRVALVVAVVVGLLVGIAPYDVPPVAAIAAGVVALVSTSVGTWLVSGGAIRPGDRWSWSFGAIGLAVGSRDLPGAVPLRRAGVVGAVVALELTVGLRGLSDRWTHGLTPMERGERAATMIVALVLALGALVAARRLPTAVPGAPAPGTRRFEERSARQTALGASAAVAVFGLVAGILPGSLDAADGHPADGGEQRARNRSAVVVEVDPGATEVGDAQIAGAEMSTEHPDEP